MKIQVDSQGKPIALNGKVLKAQEGGGLQVGYTVDANGKLEKATGDVVFSGFTEVGYKAFRLMFDTNFFRGTISSVSFPDLITINGESAFYYTFSIQNITSVYLGKLETISGVSACENMFTSNYYLEDVDLSSLTTISGTGACSGMFQDDWRLESINLENLTTISGTNACFAMFSGSGIGSVELKKLTSITGSNACRSMFSWSEDLSSIYFNSLKTISETNGLNNLVYGCNQAITIHFPSDKESLISSLSTYPTFGGSNVTLAFDLPATGE